MTFKKISQACTIYVPNMKALGQSTFVWELKQKDAGMAAAAAAAETNWKHKVPPVNQGDLIIDQKLHKITQIPWNIR